MIVFDLFGQVVQTNSAMEALLEGIGFTVESERRSIFSGP